MVKRVRTDADRKADKAYRERHKPIQLSVQYKTEDKIDGIRVKQYLDDIGMSANAYLKNLIKSDLDAKGIPYPTDPDDGASQE